MVMPERHRHGQRRTEREQHKECGEAFSHSRV
jgi:hypothetical protein